MSARFFLPAALLFLLGCGPILLAWYFMHASWVPLPSWDEWFTPAQQLISLHQGTLSLTELFSQHNESRPLFPRLVMLLLAAPAGWDVRQEMMATFVTVCAAAGAIYLLLQRSTELSRNNRLAVWALTSFLLFSPGGYENFLNARNFGNFIPGVALLFALVANVGRRSLATKTCLNASLAFIATYSMPHGLFLWLFAWPLDSQPNESSRRWLWRGIYLVATLASVAGYFWNYQHPTGTPAFVSPLAHPGLVLRYLALWSGDLFFLSSTDPLLRGATVLTLFLALAAAAIFLAARSRNWCRVYPWLVLGFFTLTSGLTAATGRLGFGLQQALDQRYTSYTVFLYVAIVGLAVNVVSAARSPALRVFAVALTIIGALLWGESLVRVRPRLAADERMRKHFLLALQWATVIPDNPEFRLITPYPETPRRIQELIRYDILRPRVITGPLTKTVCGNPAHADIPAIGKLTATSTATAGLIELAASSGPKKADCAIVGVTTADGAFSPVAVVPIGEKQVVDLTRYRDRSGELSGWAVFRKEKRAVPLAGKIPFESIR